MSFSKDGGPAFPAEEFLDTQAPNVVNPIRHSGMSLRDYFAAKAMQAGLANASLPGLVEGDPEMLAVLNKAATAFYLIADAMVAARAG